MKILGFIPARGGSQGITMKNMRKVAGKPLLEYTISSARKSKQIDKILLSTDHPSIARLGKSLGAEVPFLRPKNLSGNNSLSLDSLKHALDFLSKNYEYVPDIVVFLQPTSPTRNSDMIDQSIRMLKNSKATSVVSVSLLKKHPYNSFWYVEGNLKPFEKNFEKYSQRQSLPNLYGPTGAIYTFWARNIEKYNSIYGPKIKPLIIDDDEYAIDIDNVFDMFVSEMTILHWKKYKQKFDK